MVKLFVGNLNPQSKASDLRKKFEAFGKVTECDVVNNYGFVHMEKEVDAEAALAGLQSCILDGVKINVERSHGKRGGGPGPMRRRGDGRFREYPERFRGPPRYMDGPPPPRMGHYDNSWDDGYGAPYGPPPRSGGRSYDYPQNGGPNRYPDRGEPTRAPPRSANREPIPPPPQSYRGPPAPDAIPQTRDYPPKGAARSSGYEYDRYRDTAPPSGGRQNEYYDSYGSYGSGAQYDDYRDGDRMQPSAGYDSGYDYNYYDYGSESRSPAPPRYNYGRQ